MRELAGSSFPELRHLRHGDSAQLWQRYCGFLDLSLDDFTAMQSYLLMAQIKSVANTPLFRALVKSAIPASVQEFRDRVPITTYADYAPYLSHQQEDSLAEAPFFWCHSAGRGGNFKWIPYTRAAFDRIARYAVAGGILAAAEKRGDMRLDPWDRILVNLAPRPYASGSLIYHFAQYFPCQIIPPFTQAEELSFQERTELAFRLALKHGVDYIFSASTVLTRIGDSFAAQESKLKWPSNTLHPKVFWRVARGWLRSRLARRPMLPRDLWSPKGLITFGVDTVIQGKEIARMWGKIPYQAYGTTEMMICALQGWNKQALTFVPDMAFWEFIPESEWQRNGHDLHHQPATVLMNDLEPGKQYELVYTHFHGMSLLRYRSGDVFRVTALEDPETGVRLPQFSFQARASEIIDLAGLTQLDEKTLWQAIATTGVKYEEWCARKEYRDGRAYLRLYLELKEQCKADDLEERLENRLRAVDVDYRDLHGWLGQERSVAITLLSPGTFKRYYQEKMSEGATLAQLRPPRVNPPEHSVARIVHLSNLTRATVHAPTG